MLATLNGTLCQTYELQMRGPVLIISIKQLSIQDIENLLTNY